MKSRLDMHQHNISLEHLVGTTKPPGSASISIADVTTDKATEEKEKLKAKYQGWLMVACLLTINFIIVC